MKKIIMILVAVAFIATTSLAQNDAKKEETKSTEVTPLTNSWRNVHANQTYCMMMESKMWVWKNNEKKVMETQMTLDNGTIVFPDGNWKSKDSKSGKLKNGECIDMQGKVSPIEKSKEKSPAKAAPATPSK